MADPIPQGSWLRGLNVERQTRIADGSAAALAISLPWSTSATSLLRAFVVDRGHSAAGSDDPAAGDFDACRRVSGAALGSGCHRHAVGGRRAVQGTARRAELVPQTAFHSAADDPVPPFHSWRVGVDRLPCLLQRSSCRVMGRSAAADASPATNSDRALPRCRRQRLYRPGHGVCGLRLPIAALAMRAWRDQRRWRAGAMAFLAVIFVANVLYNGSSRTALLIVAALVVLFVWRIPSRNGASGLCWRCWRRVWWLGR